MSRLLACHSCGCEVSGSTAIFLPDGAYACSDACAVAPVARPAPALPRTGRPRGVRAVVLARDGHLCVGCGDPAEQVHHIVPRSLKGPNAPGNLVSLCPGCHGLADHDRAEWGPFLLAVTRGEA